MQRTTASGAGFLSCLLAGLAACSSTAEAPPRPGESQGAVPALEGHRVMVLPVQSTPGVEGPADAELHFALQDRGPRIGWVFPAEMREVLVRSPGLDVHMDALPVGVFRQAEVERIGDPLYGELRRLAAVADADVALVPLEVRPALDSLGAVVEDGGLEVTATLINARNGRVLWFGVVAGEPGPAADPRTLASAMDALASAVAW